MSDRAEDVLGVKGLWGLEQLERTGISTAKLAPMAVVGCTAASIVLWILFGSGVADFEFLLTATAFNGAIIGLAVFLVIALARWTQADLESLLPVAPEIAPSIGALEPSRASRAAWIAFGVAWHAVLVNGAIVSALPDLGLGDLPALWSTPHTFFLALGLPFLLGLFWGVVASTIVGQVRALAHASRHIDIDLLELDHYPKLASPLVRFVISAIALLSVLPALYLFDDPVMTQVASVGLAITVFWILVLIASYAHPVWVLRGRIRAAKDVELSYVFRALRGDPGAMARSRIADRAASLTFSELLDYRTFVESLWDWPIAPHVQRVVLIGLLPLSTWVLAALVENAVSAMVTGS